MKKLSIYITLFALLISNFAKAQHWLGASLSNFSGTHSNYTNPAFLGGTKNKLYINSFGVGINVMNDYIKWNAPFSAVDYFRGNVDAQYKNPNTNAVEIQSNWLTPKNNGSNKNLFLETEIRGPAAMVRISKKAAIAFSTRSRTAINITNVSEKLARFAVYGTDTISVSNNTTIKVGTNLDNLRINAQALSFQEYALSFGKEWLEIKGVRIKAGATAKLLMGNAYYYAKGRNMDFTVNGLDSLNVRETDFSYGYTTSNISDLSLSSLAPRFAGNVGFGWDAGISMEIDPKVTNKLTHKGSNYLLKAGISIIDGGGINFKKNAQNYDIRLRAPFTFHYDSVAKQRVSGGVSSGDGKKYVDSMINENFDVTQTSSLRYQLPTMLSLQFDYNIFKNFYVGAIIFQDIRSEDLEKVTLIRPSMVTLIPRFESKIIEVALPINLTAGYKVLQMGGYLRIGPVFFGSDNLLALLGKLNFYGVNSYFGAAFAIGGNKDKKDKN